MYKRLGAVRAQVHDLIIRFSIVVHLGGVHQLEGALKPPPSSAGVSKTIKTSSSN